MNDSIVQQLILKIKSIKLSHNLFVFGFFLLIASMFWFFNALNKEYYAEIQVPLEFTNLPENKLVAGALARSVDVKITAFGHTVMNYKTSSANSAVIDLSKHSLHRVSSDNQKFYILTSSIKEEIANELGPEVDIKKISPDSLIFNLAEVISKKVPVQSNFKLSFKKQYKLKDSIVFEPDSVSIKGVASMLDTIDFVSTEAIAFENVEDSIDVEVGVLELAGTEIKPKKIRCIIPIERFTELSLNIPITIINPPVGYSIKLFPSEAKITCNVGFSRYQQIFKEQFQLNADFGGSFIDNDSRIRLNLKNIPDGLSNIRIHPKTVEYIIEKND